MKTFTDLITEVQEKGLCHHCGGCVAFCTAINYGALWLGADGRPRYLDKDKCIECGICYAICPVINELDEETKKLVSWSPPMGPVLGTATARAMDPEVQARGTDGGVVTALLLHLFEQGRIDAAIVSKKGGPFLRLPWLAKSREEILEAAGFHFDTVPNIAHFSQMYSTYSPSIMELREVAKKAVRRVAFVGTPCQINALRRMEVLGVVPSDAIKIHFGLFCAGNFQFGEDERRRLETLGNFQWPQVYKVNLKEDLMVHLRDGAIRHIPLEELAFMKRRACLFCDDYAAEYADLSFGGLGAPEGWTTVIVRSTVGRAILTQALGSTVEASNYRESPALSQALMAKVHEWSEKKKQAAEERNRELARRAV
ncbi:MAG: Coenzyme F420 hydrogenase/dehydrogenase, beta subunit C-terminal domain [Deltaproteobacteria bacterium]|nr:Coenzyme F420 hydrogenase/dehydrogenase, beta subunit C-terminal domain [Deltaproteobacteria bacterium]